MKARIQKWGNSLAVRIPKTLAYETGIEEESEVELLLENGRLVIAPTSKPKYSLDELLEGINETNIHEEVDFGPSVGKEVW
jgi:antitoxin MazE